jgi:methylphosphotriester-DNA--protein-cysteine methyltransferase
MVQPIGIKTEAAYYKALLTHDTKFDGKFFYGVKTTGIYCRSVLAQLFSNHPL